MEKGPTVVVCLNRECGMYVSKDALTKLRKCPHCGGKEFISVPTSPHLLRPRKGRKQKLFEN